jgi:chromosome segregation ATPase
MPKAIRRIAGVLLILLGAAGLVLMLVGAVGSLRAGQYSIAVTSRTCECAERLLAVTVERTSQIKARLEKARANLAILRAQSSNLDKTLVTQRETLGRRAHDLFPQLESIRQIAASVPDSAVVLNTLLEGVRALPLAPRVELDPDQINDIADRLTDLTAEAQKLDGVLGELGGQEASLAEVEKRARRMDELLSEVSTRVGELANRLAAAQVRVAEIHSSLHRWITTAAVALIALFLWLGLGQLSLLVQGWSWCRRAGP